MFNSWEFSGFMCVDASWIMFWDSQTFLTSGILLTWCNVETLCCHCNSTYVFNLGTVENHGNAEITEVVIFVKCRESRDFAKMSCFSPKCHSFTFLQEYFVFNQHNLKFIVWIWHKNIYLSFASATKVCVLCYLLAQYVTVTTKFYG